MSDSSVTTASTAPVSEDISSSSNDSLESQELQGDVQQNLQNSVQKSPETPKSNKRQLKLKVDGQEIVEELDLDNEQELVRQLQLAKMSQKRAQEAADLRKRMDAIGEYLEQAKGDKKKLRALIKELGADEKELAAAIIEEEIANSQKTPEQIAKEKLEEELRELKDQRKREKEEWEASERERLYAQEAERYDLLVSEAISSSDLPKSPYVVKKMADYMLLGLENGVDVHPNDVINLVREEIQEDIQQMFAAMPEEVIEKIIGKDVLGKIRKRNVAKAKQVGQPPVPVKSAVKDVGAKKTENKSQDKKTFKQFFGI